MPLSERELQIQARQLVSEYMYGCMASHHLQHEGKYWCVSENWGLDEGIELTDDDSANLIEVSWELMQDFVKRLNKEVKEMRNA